MKKYLIVVVNLIFFFGCSSSISNIGVNYKMAREKKAFIEHLHPIAQIELKDDSREIVTLLPEPENNILYKMKVLSRTSKIVAVNVVEDKNLNLDMLLVPQKEYFYDSVNKELLINFNIPYLYLLKDSITVTVYINYLDKNKNIVEMVRKFVFNYKGMKKTKGNYLSYKYISINGKNLDMLNDTIVEHIKDELQYVNIKRFRPHYAKLIKDIEDNI